MAAFGPVPREKAFLKVTKQITDAIERGEYTVGEMLPSERKLCEQMEVSRPVMREAMSALQLLGMVRTRAGLGTFVVNPARASAPEMWTLAAEESPTEVMEVRQILEPAAARWAALRCTREAVATMADILGEMRAIAGEVTDATQFGTLDFRFHQAVAAAAGNDVIVKFIGAIAGYSNQRLWRSMRERSYRNSRKLALRYLEQHEKTYAHVVKSEPELAAAAMLQHLEASKAALEGEWDQDEGDQQRVP